MGPWGRVGPSTTTTWIHTSKCHLGEGGSDFLRGGQGLAARVVGQSCGNQLRTAESGACLIFALDSPGASIPLSKSIFARTGRSLLHDGGHMTPRPRRLNINSSR